MIKLIPFLILLQQVFLQKILKKVLLIAEASVKADKKDVERAYRRAQIFKKASDIETLAVLVYKEKTQLRNWV